MSMRPPPRLAGFTMLELVVALTLSAIILSSLTGLLVATFNERLRTSRRAEMTREGLFVAQLLTNDLRRAGLGVPGGQRISSAERFYAPIIAGQAGASASLGVLGDFPRPHTQYSTFGSLHHEAPSTNPLRTFSWHNENNGPCSPRNPPVAPCDVAITSVFFPGEATCDSLTARTCPWGLKRAEAGDELIVVDGRGQWEAVTLSGNFVYAPFAAVEATADWLGGIWPNNAPTAAPIGNGEGFVASLDRVYWRRNGAKIERRHCWGLGGGPTDAGWPPETTEAAPATPTGTCTPWLPVLRDVVGFDLSFFDRFNNPTTLNAVGRKASVSRVDFRIQLSTTLQGETLTHDVFGSSAIRN